MTHEAEKQQRYSLKDPVFGDLPRSVTEGINFSNSQCDNFYEYACGNWVDQATIPGDKPAWSMRWDGTQKAVDAELAELVSRWWPVDSPFSRLNDMYQACMDVNSVEVLFYVCVCEGWCR